MNLLSSALSQMFIVLHSFYFFCYLSLFAHFTPTYLFDPMNRVFRFCSWAPRRWASVWSLRQLPLPSVPLAFSPALQHLRRGECNTRRAQQATAAKQRDRERERGREGKINMTANKVQYANFNAFLMHNARCGKQIPQSGASGKEQGEHGRYLIEILPYSFVSLPVSILHVACCMLRIGSDSCAMMLFVYHNNLHYNFIIISLN